MFEFDETQLQKVVDLRSSGVNPYPSGSRIDNTIFDTDLEYYRGQTVSDLESESEFQIAVRLRFKNEMGSMGFGRVDFNGESIQISIKKNEVSPESFKAWKKLDLGDWILITGSFTRTRTGELTIATKELSLYSKCMQGMPDKISGLTDPETRHRMRYLDLIVNEDSRNTFKSRFQIVRFIRRFLDDHSFVEVETPILQPIPGGASARPFNTHHNALDTELFLRIAPELYLKRLIVGGFERVFEIGKNFRNEGISQKHNPEFTMVEFYQAHATYEDLMNLTTELLSSLVIELNSSPVIEYQGRKINFENWSRIKFEDSLASAGVADPWSEQALAEFLRYNKVHGDYESYALSDLQQKVFDLFVEPRLINPTFITHYPIQLSPLARRSDEDTRVTDRFELFINGMEIANGFSELNDPIDQASRFEAQAERKSRGDDEAMYFDKDYVRALTYGMPPTAGQGIGIDRLVMLLTNKTSIRDVILFPTRKTKDE